MTLRLLILSTIPLLLCIAAGLGLGGWLMLRNFSQSHPSIASQTDITDLKRVVKNDMLLALCFISAYAVMAILVTVGFMGGYCGWLELEIFLIIGAAMGLPGTIVLRRAESRVRNLSVDDETLREEFDHVIKRWRSSILPDW